jgi:hypothetical protein
MKINPTLTTIFVCFCFIITVFTSCTTQKNSQQTNSTSKKEDVNNCNPTITYTKGLKTIVDKNCATSGCHDASFKKMNFTSYTLLKKYADEGEIYKHVIKIKNMPPNHKLSDDELKSFKCWLEGGAQE